MLYCVLFTCSIMSILTENNSINTCTLNVNGLLDRQCQFSLKEFLLQNKVDILFLQETHVSNLKVIKELENYFDCFKCFWNFGTPFSKGTAIFISYNLNFNVIKYHKDLDGRFQFVDVNIDDIIYRLINIYAPNDDKDRCEFFEDVYPYVMTTNNKIFGGDFNCIGNPKIDKIGGNINRGKIGFENLRNIINDFELFDVYRLFKPNDVNVTWHSKCTSCRLDRLYFSNCIKPLIKNCYNVPFSFSDHDSVIVSFTNDSAIKKGKSYWKFNSSILNDNVFVKKFREWFIDFSDGLDICSEVWDYFKENIKTFCIKYCKEKNKVKYKVIKDLEKKYFLLCKEEKLTPGEFFEQISDLKEQIKQFHLDNFKGSQIRSKAKFLDNSEKPNKYFFRKEIKKGKKKNISEIKTGDVTYTQNDDIIKQFVDFYTDLFTDEEIDDDVCNFFLEDLPVLDEFEKDVCDNPVTMDEILVSLKGMENSKSPGPDGLTKEFYFKFIDIFGPMLLKLYENIFYEDSLSESQKMSYITLICKDPVNHDNVKNYRPISLMNIDVKILSKLICNRMSVVTNNIIGIDQTCALKGRSILDNAHLHRNVVDYCNQKNINCAFISLDQEKAFDKIVHKFLFKVLEKFNFGPKLIKWIKILYHDLNSCIIVNNFISQPVKISRSVKQGCSLSPLLYVLCLEPFVRKVCKDKEIEGLKLPGSPDQCKISVFADDSTGILTTEKGIKKFLYLINLFGKASGSKLNKNKTKGLWLGAWKNRKDNYKFGIDFVECIKIVGFKIGNNVTQDDIWHPIYVKFENVLNLWKFRHLSLLEKSLVVNVLATSKIWYIGSVLHMSKYYISKFQRLIFNCMWNSKSEPLARKTMYKSKDSGDLNIVNS